MTFCKNKLEGFLLLLLVSYNLCAEPDIDTIYTMSLEELMQIEITGSTLTPKSQKIVPSAVSVFTREAIDRMGFDSLQELMNLVPGFQSYRSSTGSQQYLPSSRGRRISFPASEILMVVDGQRFNEPRTTGIGNIGVKYPLDNIERVEFIRGPGAAIYGSNAMMGVINIVTRSNLNQVSLGYGSFNRKKIALQTSHKVGSVLADLFAHVEIFDGDQYKVKDSFSSNQINTDDHGELANINLKLQWKSTRISLLHSQQKSDNFYVVGYLSNGFNKNDTRITSFSIQQDLAWSSIASYLTLGYTSATLRLNTQFTAPNALASISSPSSNDALLVKIDLDGAEYRLKWHNSWTIDTHSSLQFGFEGRQIDSPENIASNNFDLGDLAQKNYPIRYYGDFLPTTPVQSESKRDILGLYGQYQKNFFETTHLSLGVRYDDYEGIGSQISPRLGLVQELNEQQSLKLLYGEAYRAPSENELHLLNNPIVLGNPDLKPETVSSWDLIWLGQWSNTNISLGYFENHFDNAIVQINTPGGAFQFNNIDQTPSKGLEFELSYQFNKHWLLRSTYTHITELPETSIREADQLASLMVNYQQNDWNFNFITSYSGERKFPIDNDGTLKTIDGYWQTFAKLSYHYGSNWESYIRVKNLFDKKYVTPPVTTIATEGIPNRGLDIVIGLNWYL